jgi:hypothetical protein
MLQVDTPRRPWTDRCGSMYQIFCRYSDCRKVCMLYPNAIWAAENLAAGTGCRRRSVLNDAIGAHEIPPSTPSRIEEGAKDPVSVFIPPDGEVSAGNPGTLRLRLRPIGRSVQVLDHQSATKGLSARRGWCVASGMSCGGMRSPCGSCQFDQCSASDTAYVLQTARRGRSIPRFTGGSIFGQAMPGPSSSSS